MGKEIVLDGESFYETFFFEKKINVPNSHLKKLKAKDRMKALAGVSNDGQIEIFLATTFGKLFPAKKL